MLLRELQAMLSRIYGLSLDLNVTDFLITDPERLRRLTDASQTSYQETLLILESEDVVDLALYLDHAMLGRLDEDDPRDELSHVNLDDFCKLLEGISHFVCFAWKASNDHCVTRLELEMQAEVDKYIGARLLLEAQNAAHDGLLNALFEQVWFDERLAPESLARYRDASDAAGRYCYQLEQKYPGKRAWGGMLADLRAFYRKPQPEKFSHINANQFG